MHTACRPQVCQDVEPIPDNKHVALKCHFFSREKQNWQCWNSRMKRDKLKNEQGLGGVWHHHQIDRLKEKKDVSTRFVQKQWLEDGLKDNKGFYLCHRSKEWAFCICVSVGHFQRRWSPKSLTWGKLDRTRPGHLKQPLWRYLYLYELGNWQGKSPSGVRRKRKSILCSRSMLRISLSHVYLEP